MRNEIEIYADYMTGVRMRVAAIKNRMAMAGTQEWAKAERVFLRFPKALELVAFASLAANKEAYAKASRKFAEEWRAKKILEKIEKINPDFWPMALNEPEESPLAARIFCGPIMDF